MNAFKKIIKAKRVWAWGITTAVLVATLIVANVLATGLYHQVICQAIGGERAITEEGENANLFVLDDGIKTKEDAFKNGNKVVKEICEEGMVLLKNENKALPLKANAKVSVFGKNSVNLVYGGSGSAAPKSAESAKTIFDSLEAAGMEVNPTLINFYKDNGASGDPRDGNPEMNNDGVSTLRTGETPKEKYTNNITSSYSQYKDAALVVFSRIAGENWDLPRKAADNDTRHYLELDNAERDLLKHICDSNVFEHVIVLINSSNMIDMGFLKFASDPAYNAKIDAAMIIGSPGGEGIMALGEILAGKINPSGHTVDTIYTHYENDPTWQNFSDNLREYGDNYFVNGTPQPYYFIDYEENIYVGYRYYETRGHLDENWYNQNVVYPFGHGLSYTTFEREIANVTELEGEALNARKGFSVKINVKNTGTVAGKDVVQLYVSTPYTDGGIEKPYKTLVGFAKTSLLQPDASETLAIDVTPYDFASFDSDDMNHNDFKGFELEAGDYTFFAGINAHTDFGHFTKNLATGEKFDKDPVTGYEVKPLFEHGDDHLQQDLSRTDFEGTFPVIPGDDERNVTAEFIAAEDNRDSGNKEDLSVMPTLGAELTVPFKNLVGKEYNDELWDKFLNQMTFQEMVDLFNEGCYSTTAKLGRLGIPKTLSADGPTGIVNFQGNPEIYDTCYYCSECLVAQTYNLNLVEAQGSAIGNECLIGDTQRPNGSGLPYTGWYAPGVNLHRSPFSGRNTEYYSEDPFLSGKFAAHLIQKVQEKGVYANVKHFALNDAETHRSLNGVNTWCKEQAIRELYLKPFEMAVKEGKTRGLMTSFNRIGQKWTGGDYNLVTIVLRKEWGFVGSVICDYHTDAYMDNAQMIYAGGDLNLTADKPWAGRKAADPNNPGDVNCLRRAAHNNLYAIVNSNAMRATILGYKLPIWEVILYVVDGVLAGGLAVWGFFAFFTAIRKKEQ